MGGEGGNTGWATPASKPRGVSVSDRRRYRVHGWDKLGIDDSQPLGYSGLGTRILTAGEEWKLPPLGELSLLFLEIKPREC